MGAASGERVVDRTLAKEWDDLADRASAPPFLRPGWFSAWTSAFGRGPMVVATVRRGGELTGVLPLLRRRTGWASPTNWHTPAFGPVVADMADARSLAERVVSSDGHQVDLRFLDADDAASTVLRSTLDVAGHRTIERVLERSPYIDATARWDDYVVGRDARFVRELRRRRRRLGEHGDVALDVADGSVSLDDRLSEGFAVEASGWKGRTGTAISASPATREFYASVARWAADRGWLRLAFLRVDGRAVAFDFALEDAHAHYLLKSGYDPDLGRCSPGNLLRWEMLQRTFSSAVSTYELLGRDEAWKLDWTPTSRARLRLQVFRSSVPGVLFWSAWRYGRPAARRMLRRARSRP